jgi:hypothetical protein
VRGRLLFVAGLGTGFVLGSRAGRRAYEQLRSRAQTLSQNPAVQSTVAKARDVVQERAPKLSGVVGGIGRTATDVGRSAQQAGAAGGGASAQPVGAEQTGTDAAGGGEIGEGSPGVGPVGTEATAEADDAER